MSISCVSSFVNLLLRSSLIYINFSCNSFNVSNIEEISGEVEEDEPQQPEQQEGVHCAQQ